MKKRNMKMTSAVLAAALAAVSLAGCGGSGKTEGLCRVCPCHLINNTVSAAIIKKVAPTFWWADMKNPELQQKLVLKLKAAKQQAGKQRKAATR